MQTDATQPIAAPSAAPTTGVGGKVDGALSLLGTFRIWIGIVVGALVALVAAFAFAGSFFWGTSFERLDADVASVSCGQPVKTTKCTTSNDSRKCVTDTQRTCDLGLKFALAGKPFAETLKGVAFQDGHEPSADDKLSVYVDTAHPAVVKMPDAPDLITPQKRVLIRVVSAIVLVVSLVSVVINVHFRRNQNFQRLQGAFGAMDAVGNMLGGR